MQTDPGAMTGTNAGGDANSRMLPTSPAAPDGNLGSEIAPAPPQAEMHAIDILAGQVDDRTASPADFTGGDTETGLGGTAEEPPAGGIFHDRIGF